MLCTKIVLRFESISFEEGIASIKIVNDDGDTSLNFATKYNENIALVTYLKSKGGTMLM